MKLYLKNLVQLVLSPGKGWEDVSASHADDRGELLASFYRLLAVCSLSEFVQVLYGKTDILTAVGLTLAMFGSYFISYFAARAVIDHYMERFGEASPARISGFVIYWLGLLVIIELIENLLPTDLTLVKFLPLFVGLILYRGSVYMSVRQGSEFGFLCLSAVAVIVVPIVLYSILSLIIS